MAPSGELRYSQNSAVKYLYIGREAAVRQPHRAATRIASSETPHQLSGRTACLAPEEGNTHDTYTWAS